MGAASGSSADLYPEYFLVSQNSGAAMSVKFLTWVHKKLKGLTNEGIVLMYVGGLASLIAFSLFLLGLIPSRVRGKLRYETSLFPKMHFSKLIIKWFLCMQVSTLYSTIMCF